MKSHLARSGKFTSQPVMSKLPSLAASRKRKLDGGARRAFKRSGYRVPSLDDNWKTAVKR